MRIASAFLSRQLDRSCTLTRRTEGATGQRSRRATLAYSTAFDNSGAGIRVGNNGYLGLSPVTAQFNSNRDIDGDGGHVESDGTSYIYSDNLTASNYATYPLR